MIKSELFSETKIQGKQEKTEWIDRTSSDFHSEPDHCGERSPLSTIVPENLQV
jgi:hypothetical protein